MTHIQPVLFLNTTLQNSTGKLGLLYCTNDVIYETEASSHHLFPKQQTLCLCISRWPRCTRGCCYRWSVSSPCSSPPPSSSTPGEGRVIFTLLRLTHSSYSHCRLYTLKTMMVSCAICLLFAQIYSGVDYEYWYMHKFVEHLIMFLIILFYFILFLIMYLIILEYVRVCSLKTCSSQ